MLHISSVSSGSKNVTQKQTPLRVSFLFNATLSLWLLYSPLENNLLCLVSSWSFFSIYLCSSPFCLFSWVHFSRGSISERRFITLSWHLPYSPIFSFAVLDFISHTLLMKPILPFSFLVVVLDILSPSFSLLCSARKSGGEGTSQQTWYATYVTNLHYWQDHHIKCSCDSARGQSVKLLGLAQALQ